MPHKPIGKLSVPSWIKAIENDCLRELLVEVFVAQFHAEEDGARNHPQCKAALKSAETTLQMIADGRVTGKQAWKKATDALRKFNTARECAKPTASCHASAR
jgi:hypothetical protein